MDKPITEWTNKEIVQLVHDLKVAQVRVFVKYGFSVDEICRIMDLPESVVRMLINLTT